MRVGMAKDLLTLVMVLLATGCGTGNTTRPEDASPPEMTATSAAIDPCALVTAAEAEEALGASVESDRPAETNTDYLAACRYAGPRAGSPFADLVVTVSRRNGRAAFESVRRMQEVGIAIEPVPDMGDEAFWAGDPLNALYVLQNEVYLGIRGDIDDERARALALQAVSRLP